LPEKQLKTFYQPTSNDKNVERAANKLNG